MVQTEQQYICIHQVMQPSSSGIFLVRASPFLNIGVRKLRWETRRYCIFIHSLSLLLRSACWPCSRARRTTRRSGRSTKTRATTTTRASPSRECSRTAATTATASRRMKRGSLVLRTAMMMDAEFAVPRQFFTQCRNLLKAERKEGRKERRKSQKPSKRLASRDCYIALKTGDRPTMLRMKSCWN